MIAESLIRQLKQVNVSTDTEKTKLRTNIVWKSASKDAQQAILQLTGLKRTSVQRAYKTGSISAKLGVAIAQTLDIDPYYLTGEVDEQGGCSEELLRSFLIAHGYQKLLPEQAAKKRRRRARANQETVEQAPLTAVPDAAPVAEADTDAPETEAMPISEETRAFLSAMTEEQVILLVKAVLLRANAGGEYAEAAETLKLFLLS